MSVSVDLPKDHYPGLDNLKDITSYDDIPEDVKSSTKGLRKLNNREWFWLAHRMECNQNAMCRRAEIDDDVAENVSSIVTNLTDFLKQKRRIERADRKKDVPLVTEKDQILKEYVFSFSVVHRGAKNDDAKVS